MSTIHMNMHFVTDSPSIVAQATRLTTTLDGLWPGETGGPGTTSDRPSGVCVHDALPKAGGSNRCSKWQCSLLIPGSGVSSSILDASKANMYTLLHHEAVCVHARAVRMVLTGGGGGLYAVVCKYGWVRVTGLGLQGGMNWWIVRLQVRWPAPVVYLPDCTALRCTSPVSVLGVLGGV